MSIYTTPLHFGYFLGLLFALLILVRGIREERLSDKLLAAVLFLLSMEIQDYTYGFSGINYLWEELNGFPRHFGLAFAPTIYFYLKSQINRSFKLNSKHLWHYIPYAIYFIFYLVIFINGKEAVENWQTGPYSRTGGWVEFVVQWSMYIFYFYNSLKIYKEYRSWAETQFSDTEIYSFNWLRNFIYLIISGEVFKLFWNVTDYLVDMPYEKDWWWHLFTVCIICYVGIRGYSQFQPKKINFEPKEIVPSKESNNSILDENQKELISKIEILFKTEKVFLEPEISLSELSKKLKTNSSVLSATINQGFGKNFNDFVNEYRIREFEKEINNPDNKNYTKLAIALDCGFNSKATFNRALKKFGV